MKPIQSLHLSAFAHCPYKAYLLLCSEEKGTIREYEQFFQTRKQQTQEKFLLKLQTENEQAKTYESNILKKGYEYILNPQIVVENFELNCPILNKSEGKSSLGNFYYEPIIFIETNKIAQTHKIELAFLAFLLEKIQKKFPLQGTIIDLAGKTHRVKLNPKPIRPILEKIKDFETEKDTQVPRLILNKHCNHCQFKELCHTQAQKEDNLSLLSRISAKEILKYEKKGIFTVKQLSFVYKPRRRNRHTKRPSTNYKPELQAMAIRTEKIYIQQLPNLNRKTTEIFLDIEGLPDENFHYLFGLLIVSEIKSEYLSFWLDNKSEEEKTWHKLIELLGQYPETPIYHYGSFEIKAFEKLSKHYKTDISSLKKNFININSFIFGKIYFPTYSNALKDLGKLLGAKWSSAQADGIQSIVWRLNWETQKSENLRNNLLTYNQEDCLALQVLTNELSKIQANAAISNDMDFVVKPKKIATENSKEIHHHFKSILECSYSNYDKRKIKFNYSPENEQIKSVEKKAGSKKGFKGQRQKKPKPSKIIEIKCDDFCYKHKHQALTPITSTSNRLIIDLVFTKNGVRKRIIQYKGFQGYCKVCNRTYAPEQIRLFGKAQLYGYNYKVWIVYHRIKTQISYEKIIENMNDFFADRMQWTYSNVFIKEFSELYFETEDFIYKKLLKSPFIHADETPLNIRGATQYAWVFTNGKYVIFKLSTQREAITAQEFLKDYKGVLISDFFAGYDNIDCPQQKCWVHFIRDLNNDLWANPFDKEYENFVAEVRNLLLPMIQAIHKYGLKKRNLNKFNQQVENFYQKHIDTKVYKSESCILYQKRFIRYRESLFTFLKNDGINWHNNPAELGIRHICKQQTISGSFYESLTPHYLRLVGIMQTCRFQKKSFLKFLLSKEKDIDAFKG